MKNTLLAVLLVASVPGPALGQANPSITNVTNGAIPALDYPTASIHLAPRSIATIFGTNLADTTVTAVAQVTTLGGTEIHLATDACLDSSCELVANLFYVSPTQINFLVPDNGSSTCRDCTPVAYRIVFIRDGQRIDDGLGGRGRLFIDPYDFGDYNLVFVIGFDCLFSYSLIDPSSCGFSIAEGQHRAPQGTITDAASGQLISSQYPVYQGQIVTLWMTALYGGVVFNNDTGLWQQSNPSPIGFGVAQLSEDMANSIYLGPKGLVGTFMSPAPIWAGEQPQTIGLDQVNVAFPMCTNVPPATVEKRFDAFLPYTNALTGNTVRLYIPFVVRPGDPDCNWLLRSTTTLSSNINPSGLGQTVTFTATVSPPPVTGTVSFFDGSAALGTMPLGPGLPVSGGATSAIATYSTAGLSAGPHSIVAIYNGDTRYQGSSTTSLQTVLRSTTTTVTSNSNPSLYGQVMFTATIYPSDATGAVTFFAELNRLGTVGVINGIATVSAASLSTGTHSILATYSGDNKYQPSSGTLTQVVIPNTPSVTLTANPNPAVFRQLVDFSVSVCCAATGTVTFFDGGSILGSGTLAAVPVSGGSAGTMQTTLSTASLNIGTHSITARYNGDQNNNANTSGVILQVIGSPFSTTITLFSNINPSSYGQSVTFTSVVSPSSATGTVTFFDGSTSIGTAALGPSAPVSGGVGSGTAILTTSALLPGTHSITARYNGDNNYNPSSSSNVVLQVIGSPFSTTITLFSNINPSSYGQSVTFTSVVSPSSATGTVTFFDGSTSIGTAPLGPSAPVSGGVGSGTAILTTSALLPGTHSITARYNGDNRYASSVAALVQIVN
jgi:hypothetical protein